MNIIEHNKNGLVYLTADGFEAAGGVAHGFSTRLGGVSEGIYATLNLGMNRGAPSPRRIWASAWTSRSLGRRMALSPTSPV